MTLQAIQSSTDDFLQEEIDSNRRLLLQHLDTYLRQTQTLDSISLTELELDRLIISEVAKRSGMNLFDNTTTYLTKITQGNLYLKEYAQETRILHSHLYITVADKEKIKNLRQNLTSLTNETKDIIKMVRHADSLVPIRGVHRIRSRISKSGLSGFFVGFGLDSDCKFLNFWIRIRIRILVL